MADFTRYNHISIQVDPAASPEQYRALLAAIKAHECVLGVGYLLRESADSQLLRSRPMIVDSAGRVTAVAG